MPMGVYPRTCPVCNTVFQSVPVGRHKYIRVTCSDPCADAVLKIPLADRFWKYVNKTETCWLWTGKDVNQKGYGRIRRGGYTGGRIGVHCAAWEMASGLTVPEGWDVAHTCDTPGCVRNDPVGTYEVKGISYPLYGHLFACPHAANEADKVAKGRQARGAGNGRVLHPDSYPKGAEWPMAKLNDDAVIEMRRLYDGRHATQMELAAQFGLRQSSVWAIVRHKSWKHLP